MQKITCYRLKHIYNRIIRLLHKSIFNDGWEKLSRLQFIGYNEQYCAVHKQRFCSMCLNQRCQHYIGHRHTFHYCISKSLVGKSKSKLPCFLKMSVFTIWRIFDWNAHIILAVIMWESRRKLVAFVHIWTYTFGILLRLTRNILILYCQIRRYLFCL